MRIAAAAIRGKANHSIESLRQQDKEDGSNMSWSDYERYRRAYIDKGSKYHAEKVTVDGIVFDSRKEARRWSELCLMEKAGQIMGLRRQVKFLLIPEYREPDTTGPRGGIRRGKLIESAVYYRADFVYTECEAPDVTVVEDVKGFKTKEYILKRKLMLHKYGIRIRET